MNNRIIPKKNYVILFMLAVITIIITLLLANKYNKNLQYNLSENDNMSFLSQIKIDEIDNYIMDNPESIIYMSSSDNTELDKVEEDLKKYIISNNYNKNIVYLNSYDLEESKFNEFKEKYFSELIKKNINLNIQPNIFVIKNGVVFNALYTNDSNDVNIDDIKIFLRNNIEVTE